MEYPDDVRVGLCLASTKLHLQDLHVDLHVDISCLVGLISRDLKGHHH